MSTLYTFDGFDELYETAEDLPDAETHDIFAHHTDNETWDKLPWRQSIYLEDGRGPAGDTSSSDQYYTVIDYGEILEATGRALEEYDDVLTPVGHVSLSDSGHRMTSMVDFDGVSAAPAPEDVIDLGMRVRAGHSGSMGIHYDIGAERQVCSNGMVAFISDMHRSQSHSEALDYTLPRESAQAIVEGADVVESRLQQAQQHSFVNEDEAVLVLTDLGLDMYFDDPIPVLEDAVAAEVADGSEPTLYDAYNAATRAITHESGLESDRRDQALSQASQLLDQYGELPSVGDLGATAIENRVDEVAGGDDVDRYWEDEEMVLDELVAARRLSR